jgi:hypothetical protein
MQLFSVCDFWSPLLICIWRDNVSKNLMLLEFTFKFQMKGMLISDHKYAPKFSLWLLVPLSPIILVIYFILIGFYSI